MLHTHCTFSTQPEVNFASPVLHPPSVAHSSRSEDPAALWIAPSTPPPPSKEELAAFTMAPISSRVISPCHKDTFWFKVGAKE